MLKGPIANSGTLDKQPHAMQQGYNHSVRHAGRTQLVAAAQQTGTRGRHNLELQPLHLTGRTQLVAAA